MQNSALLNFEVAGSVGVLAPQYWINPALQRVMFGQNTVTWIRAKAMNGKKLLQLTYASSYMLFACSMATVYTQAETIARKPIPQSTAMLVTCGSACSHQC